MSDTVEELKLTAAEAEYWIFGLANDQGIFALEVGIMANAEIQEAFIRGNAKMWNLIDITPLPGQAGIFRIFKLSFAGAMRKQELKDLAKKAKP